MSITVLGECVADAFATDGRPGELSLTVHPGGGPANTATALARLGTRTRFLGRLAADPFGALFRDRLAGSGVDLSGCVAAAEPSTLAIAALDAEGRAGYTFHAEGTADFQWQPAELAAVDLTQSVAVHTGSLALVRAPAQPPSKSCWPAPERTPPFRSIRTFDRCWSPRNATGSAWPPGAPSPTCYACPLTTWRSSTPISRSPKSSTTGTSWAFR